jgi:hypothetical protein
VFPKSQCAGGPGGSGNLELRLPGRNLKAARHRVTIARAMTIVAVCENGIGNIIVFGGAILVVGCPGRFLEQGLSKLYTTIEYC